MALYAETQAGDLSLCVGPKPPPAQPLAGLSFGE